jgi:hypothetical protein
MTRRNLSSYLLALLIGIANTSCQSSDNFEEQEEN